MNQAYSVTFTEHNGWRDTFDFTTYRKAKTEALRLKKLGCTKIIIDTFEVDEENEQEVIRWELIK